MTVFYRKQLMLQPDLSGKSGNDLRRRTERDDVLLALSKKECIQ
jgi:hypothetical protein